MGKYHTRAKKEYCAIETWERHNHETVGWKAGNRSCWSVLMVTRIGGAVAR